MHPRSDRRTIIGVAGAVAAAGVVVGLVFVVNADEGFASCTGTSEFGWLAPLLAASIIAGLAWVLLSQDPRSRDDATDPPVAQCPECNRTVLGQWRMCPYCGEMLDPRQSPSLSVPQGK